MFGPSPGPRRRNGIALAVATVTASLTGWSSAACAEDAPREAVIGTFESTAAARAAQGRPATFDFQPGAPESRAPAAAGRVLDPVADDDETSRMFADALDDLEAGKAASAQRKFELVVGRDPDSHLARSARAHLADLYRDSGIAGTSEAAARPAQPKFATPRAGLGAADVAVTSDRGPALPADGAMPVAPGVEEEFITEAGDRVFFGSASAELGQRARAVLAAQARWLANHPDLVAVIEGHADDGTMPDEQSAKLSAQRAAAVRDRLVTEGIPERRLYVAGVGRTQPVATCGGPDCAAQNRRVVTVLKSLVREGGRRGGSQSFASDLPPQAAH
jgi:peptidoglycan-associated lipoprotein